MASPTAGKNDCASQPLGQLLITGNGFDLECKLESRFEDFFTSKQTSYKLSSSRADTVEILIHMEDEDEMLEECSPKRSEYRELVGNLGITIWDLILLEHKDKYWFDIEKAIERFVCTDSGSNPTNKLGSAIWTMNGLRDGSNADPLARKSLDRNYARLAEFVLNTIEHDELPSSDNDSLYRYLLRQLNQLESKFQDYLQQTILLEKEYGERARSLFEDLLEADPCHAGVTEVLSFNYTRPPTPNTRDARGAETQIPIVCVHGDLVGPEIVFGIDDLAYGRNKLARPFCKTARAVSMGGPCIAGLLSARDVPVSCIKTYGHSLAEADHSYFQAIFDAVDLYGGETRLIFYYRPPWDKEGNRTSAEKAREEVLAKVFDLLERYGATMDNQSHGKNLMKKLQLEGRLSVKLLQGKSF